MPIISEIIGSILGNLSIFKFMMFDNLQIKFKFLCISLNPIPKIQSITPKFNRFKLSSTYILFKNLNLHIFNYRILTINIKRKSP